MANFDVYSPAATAAKLSFDEVFPEKKKKEVLAFCKHELLEVIYILKLLWLLNNICVTTFSVCIIFKGLNSLTKENLNATLKPSSKLQERREFILFYSERREMSIKFL